MSADETGSFPEDGELPLAVELGQVRDAIIDALDDCESGQGADAINSLRWASSVLRRLVRDLDD